MNIVYEDKQLIICEKPVGVSSEEGGVPDELEKLCGGRVYCVHRLDKAVGGLMVYARTGQCAAALSRMIAEGGLTKEYLAIVPDRLSEPSGCFEDLLFHDKQKNKSYVVKRMRKGVKNALLEYEKLGVSGSQCLVRIKLITGRSHQIRCQFASRSMPLAGDVKYGSSVREHDIALFSYRLSFEHPFSGKQLDISLLPSQEFWKPFDLKRE